MELTHFENVNIQVHQGGITFLGHAALKEQAANLAELVANVEVTEDNIKESKKLLAAVNKKVKELETHRIAVKKELLEPYQEFERKVKEITGVVNDANDVVRKQVRELEEQERANKKYQIRDIWGRRIQMYDFKGHVGFDDFIDQKHLNKSYSIDKVEQEMVAWFTQIENDLHTINTLPLADQLKEAYFGHAGLDINLAIRMVNPFPEVAQKQPEKVLDTKTYLFTVDGLTDEAVKEIEALLHKNSLSFQTRVLYK